MKTTVDATSAVGNVAYYLSEIIPIYPITPSSPMAEYSSKSSAEGKTNIFGEKVTTIEMQSEAGVAGTLHGALDMVKFRVCYFGGCGECDVKFHRSRAVVIHDGEQAVRIFGDIPGACQRTRKLEQLRKARDLRAAVRRTAPVWVGAMQNKLKVLHNRAVGKFRRPFRRAVDVPALAVLDDGQTPGHARQHTGQDAAAVRLHRGKDRAVDGDVPRLHGLIADGAAHLPGPLGFADSDLVARGAGDGGDPECAAVFAQECDTVGAGRICNDGVLVHGFFHRLLSNRFSASRVSSLSDKLSCVLIVW